MFISMLGAGDSHTGERYIWFDELPHEHSRVCCRYTCRKCLPLGRLGARKCTENEMYSHLDDMHTGSRLDNGHATCD